MGREHLLPLAIHSSSFHHSAPIDASPMNALAAQLSMQAHARLLRGAPQLNLQN